MKQIQIESSATTTASSLLAYCDQSALVLDLYTGKEWIYSGGQWIENTHIGPQGAQGSDGAQGANGVDGVQGAQGHQGASVQGPQGASVQGPQGSQGHQGLTGAIYSTSATSSLSIANGYKTLTVASGLSYTVGQRVSIAYNSSNYMYARVVSYSGTSLQVNVDRSFGSGTYTSWLVNLCGDHGSKLTSTSTTSLQIYEGSRSLAVEAYCDFQVDQRIAVVYDRFNTMWGYVTSYNQSSGMLTFTCDNYSGSGTYADWKVSLSGERGYRGAQGSNGAGGAQGPQGYQGAQGNQGAQGATFTYNVPSHSSRTIGTGSLTFNLTLTVLPNPYSVGQRVVISYDASNYMIGNVTGTNGTLIGVLIDSVTGSGNYSTWTVNLYGIQGNQGNQGNQGYQGEKGTQGNQGKQGNQGNQGSTGSTGSLGAQGPQGTQGNQGKQGSTGNAGSQGYQGNQGTQGFQGIQGNQGFQGTSTMNITISTANPSGAGNEGDIWVVVPA